MSPQKSTLKSVNEIGKVYNFILDRSSLCDFFPQSMLMMVEADQALLFLAGASGRIWLESSAGRDIEDPDKLLTEAQKILDEGKPVLKPNLLFTPLVIRNNALGIACFVRAGLDRPFTAEDLEIAVDLASQMAGAFKNTLLVEQNIEMEKLAAIGQSMSAVLHEIKNINQIASYAGGWLKRGIEKQNPKHLQRGYEGIQKAIREMNGFVYEILSLTKNYEIEPQKVNLEALLCELKEDLQDRAEQTQTALDFQVDASHQEIEGEERMLFRALLNLAKNALEARDEGKENGFVRIRVQPKNDGFYEIAIQDNGIGMSDEVKAKLLQAFFSTKGKQGTGLGVMIVDRTVKAHHGTMAVESTQGEGTSIRLTLPKSFPRVNK